MHVQQPILVILSLLSVLVVGKGRIAIDRRSCKDDVYPHIQYGVDTAMRWARETANELDRPLSEMESRIVEKMRWLLGDDDKMTERRRKPMRDAFSRIGALEIVDVDVYGDEWKQTQSEGDITVVCNGDYLTHVPSGDFPDYPYLNVLRDEWVGGDDDEVKMKKGGETKTRMRTTLPDVDHRNQANNPNNKADMIIIHTHYIKKEKKRGWPRLTEERVQKVVNPNFFKKLKNKAERFQEKFLSLLKIDDRTRFAPIQVLDTFESTMLHELTHTRVGHKARDLPADACYGWINAMECQNPLNADSLMWLALSFHFIREYGYDVTENGKLKMI